MNGRGDRRHGGISRARASVRRPRRNVLMQTVLTASQLHLLRMIFDRGTRSGLAGALEMAGARDSLGDQRCRRGRDRAGGRAARVRRNRWSPPVRWDSRGWLTGLIILVFKDSSGLALSDLLMHQAIGTTTTWGELEESAAKETTNIVGCAYVNALATHLPRAPAPAVARSGTREQGREPPAIWYRRRPPSSTSLPAACFSSRSWSRRSSWTRFSFSGPT